MDRLKKALFLLVASACLLFVILGLFSFSFFEKDSFAVQSLNHGELLIRPFAKEDKLFYFLPSGTDAEDFVLKAENTADGNRALLAELAQENSQVSYKGGMRSVEILAADQIPTLYIELLKKDIDYLNSNKEHRLDIKAYLYDEKGGLLADPIKGTIKGRGNNSWNADKKAYNLNFESRQSLLGMNEAEKWVLISNGMDPTLLYNKSIYDLGRQTGLEWTPECEFVNLYLNGEYYGLYLLSEKVEVEKGRLELKRSESLLKRELNERLDIVDNGFLTDHGNVMEITYPKKISSFHKQEVEKQVQKMEDVIFDLESEEWKDVIDIDSWARCYLIDEIFDNFDAGIASAYFYIKEDGTVCRGPIWDYDAILFDNPDSIIANSQMRQPYSANDYYYHLYLRDDFKNRVKDLFEKELKPLINGYFFGRVDELAEKIDRSRYMDCLRWNVSSDKTPISYFKDYVEEKIRFLDEYWNDEKDYCKIQIQKETYFLTYMVKKGEMIDRALNIDMDLFDGKTYFYEDGREFKIDDIIKEDIRLRLTKEPSEDANGISYSSGLGVLNIVFLSAFGLLFIAIAYRFFKNYE